VGVHDASLTQDDMDVLEGFRDADAHEFCQKHMACVDVRAGVKDRKYFCVKIKDGYF
jgi:hypothetical protein